MRLFFSLFVYVSLIFLAVALYRADYLVPPPMVSPTGVGVSVLLLLAGFLFDALTWQKTLGIMGCPVGLVPCIVSIGLSIFGKYIPGKIWLIAGRSVYIGSHCSRSAKDLLTISVICQLISVWTGLLFGLAGLLFIHRLQVWGMAAAFFWAGITVVLFWKTPHRLFVTGVRHFRGPQFDIPFIDFRQIVRVLPWFLVRWTVVSVSFYWFIAGINTGGTPFYTGLAYPLAGTLGLIAVFTPGGLGVREGVLAGFFSFAGFSLAASATLSVAARLWYLAGEAAIFCVALALSLMERRKKEFPGNRAPGPAAPPEK